MKPKSSPRKDGPGQGARKGPSQRQLRVGEEIRHVLAEIFLRTEFHDHALAKAHLTISEVRMSPDLKHALGLHHPARQPGCHPLAAGARARLPLPARQIAPKLGLRVTPDLKFMADEALEEATRINKLLHRPEVARDLGQRRNKAQGAALHPPGPDAPDPH